MTKPHAALRATPTLHSTPVSPNPADPSSLAMRPASQMPQSLGTSVRHVNRQRSSLSSLIRLPRSSLTGRGCTIILVRLSSSSIRVLTSFAMRRSTRRRAQRPRVALAHRLPERLSLPLRAVRPCRTRWDLIRSLNSVRNMCAPSWRHFSSSQRL